MGERKLGDGAFQITPGQQHRAPVPVVEGQLGRHAVGGREPAISVGRVPGEGRDPAPGVQAGFAIQGQARRDRPGLIDAAEPGVGDGEHGLHAPFQRVLGGRALALKLGVEPFRLLGQRGPVAQLQQGRQRQGGHVERPSDRPGHAGLTQTPHDLVVLDQGLCALLAQVQAAAQAFEVVGAQRGRLRRRPSSVALVPGDREDLDPLGDVGRNDAVAAFVATQLLLQSDVVITCLQSPQIHFGEVLDGHPAGLIEVQARPYPLVDDRHRAGVVAALHQHGGPAGVGPLALFPGARLGEAPVEGEGVVGMAVRGQEDGVAVGLGLGVEGLGRFRHEAIDVAVGPSDRLAGLLARPRGDRDARRGANHLAGDAGLMA